MKRLRPYLIATAWCMSLQCAPAQQRPYIGYAYPAGGQQGTTVQVRLGGQNLDGVNSVLVTGTGVTARVVEFDRRLNNQEVQLLNEQLKVLKQSTSSVAKPQPPVPRAEDATMAAATAAHGESVATDANDTPRLITRIEKRTREFVQTPACAAISSIAIVEVEIAENAAPGQRELRLATPTGVSNPLSFHIGQLREYARKPMLVSLLQVLGKEGQSLRKRPADEVEMAVQIPCAVNGQIASGEVNRYRFTARRGQRLVVSTLGRQLVPYIADAVPGWFQPVVALYDANGREVVFADDYQFKPDPVMLCDILKDGEYVLAIHDAIFRGREDFVYRMSIGELPFITSIYPPGRQTGTRNAPNIEGWNVQNAKLTLPAPQVGPGVYTVSARGNRLVSNPVTFVTDTLPEALDEESNNTQRDAQRVSVPVVVNGRMDQPNDVDVFRFDGKSNETVVAEVTARRLDSPLDSVLKVTDGSGRTLAFSDDREDIGAGINTHHADSYLIFKPPSDGYYFVHLSDTARQGGGSHTYRLRISPPQTDFALRVVPSSVSLRSKSTATLTVYATRKDGFKGRIKVGLKDPPSGFSAVPVTLNETQTVARLTLKTTLAETETPLDLVVSGTTRIGSTEIERQAVPAEDRMQAFLWRHLVPAQDLKAVVFNPATPRPSARPLPIIPTNALAKATISSNTPSGTNQTAATTTDKPKFTKQQIAGRLRQLKLLYEDGLLTDDFYQLKVAECEAGR